jgi:Glycosyltransferase family 87
MSVGSIRERRSLDGAARGIVRSLPRLVAPLLLAAAALVCVKLVVVAPDGAIDFRTGVWQPAADILHGISPYPPAQNLRAQDGMPSIYPPFIALLAIPFGFLSYALASALWTLTLIAALVLTLRVLGVRDWRLYGAVFVLPQVMDALMLGQVEILLVLAAALVWRYRDRWLIAAIALGAAMAVKPLMFPLVAWLLITRRIRASVASVLVALGLALGSWTVIGYSGMRSYPALLQAWDHLYAGCGISLSALALKLGSPGFITTALPLVAAAALLAFAWRVARGVEGDRRAFSAAVCAVVVAAPVVWSHYLVYLVVPLALAAPRLGWRWLPLALPWVFGHETSVTMYLQHTAGRIVPTASSVGSDTYLVLLEYLLATAAIIFVVLRARGGARGPSLRTRPGFLGRAGGYNP